MTLTLAGESGVSEEAMANTAKMLEEKKISKEDNGSVIVDFEGLVPGKEGKRLGKTVIR
jgi:arginyl-tRNA synthetase